MASGALVVPASAQPKPFLTKLFKMVDDPETDAIVSWTPAGDALVVHDDEKFAQNLLPLHFKHNNFSSFVRQLNTYGFSKVDPDRWIFAHLHFRRDAREHINLIQRKSSHRPSSQAASSAITTTAPPGEVKGEDPQLTYPPQLGVSTSSTSADGAGDTPLEEEALQAELRAIRGHHLNMATRIRELNSQLQQTKAQQQNTRESIGKIVAFLSQVYHSATGRQGGAGGSAVTFPGSSILAAGPSQEASALEDPAVHQAKRPRIEQTPADSLTPQSEQILPGTVAGASTQQATLPLLEEMVMLAPATAPPSALPVENPIPPPLPVTPQISLGEEAARALPEDLQDVALHLYSNPEMQDAVLEQVQSGIADGSGPDSQPSDAEDLEAFLWDFLEANQDNVESRNPSQENPPSAEPAS